MDKFNATGFHTVSDTDLEHITGGGTPIYWGANGYLSRDSHGNFEYTVTKSPTQAVLGVMAHGWYSALAGSWV